MVNFVFEQRNFCLKSTLKKENEMVRTFESFFKINRWILEEILRRESFLGKILLPPKTEVENPGKEPKFLKWKKGRHYIKYYDFNTVE